MTGPIGMLVTWVAACLVGQVIAGTGHLYFAALINAAGIVAGTAFLWGRGAGTEEAA